MSGFDHLINLGDPDELTREIDRLCSRRDWDGLPELRRKCRAAVDTGRQLWGAAAHAEYRLALEAPGDVAASVVDSVPAPSALGPLAEVAASTHTWAELQAGAPDGPAGALLAYECVARGENLSDDDALALHVSSFGLPLALAHWEPAYPAALYKGDSAVFARPALTVFKGVNVERDADFELLNEPEFADAAAELVAPWLQHSNGRLQTAVVAGGMSNAVAALDLASLSMNQVTSADALARIAWVAAHGGYHGRRRGMAAGRTKAWFLLAALAGVADEWPLPLDVLGETAAELQWWTWGSDDESALELRLMIVDPADEVTFVIDAWDTES